MNVFEETRSRVTAEDAARYFGLTINRHKALCPFHREKTPSFSFKNGRYHCFGCGASGNSIDYTMRLLGVDALGAVRELNRAFALGLPLDKPPDREALRAVQRRRELAQIQHDFEQWQNATINRLNECLRLAHLIQRFIERPADLDQLSDLQVFVIEKEPYFEYLSDLLTFGTPDDQMEVFRMRKEVDMLCQKLLIETPMKLTAA